MVNKRRPRRRRTKKSNTDILFVLVGTVVVLGAATSANIDSGAINASVITLLIIGAVIAVLLGAFILYELRKRQQALMAVELRDVDSMNGIEFEDYLAVLFKARGYKVTKTPTTGDHGVDLLLEKDKNRIVVQAKNYKNSVDQKAIREAVAGMAIYRADKSMAITNSTFTVMAKALAVANNCELIDRVRLGEMILDFQKGEHSRKRL